MTKMSDVRLVQNEQLEQQFSRQGQQFSRQVQQFSQREPDALDGLRDEKYVLVLRGGQRLEWQLL